MNDRWEEEYDTFVAQERPKQLWVVCGDTKSAKMYSGSWMKTLCDKCDKERNDG